MLVQLGALNRRPAAFGRAFDKGGPGNRGARQRDALAGSPKSPLKPSCAPGHARQVFARSGAVLSGAGKGRYLPRTSNFFPVKTRKKPAFI